MTLRVSAKPMFPGSSGCQFTRSAHPAPESPARLAEIMKRKSLVNNSLTICLQHLGEYGHPS